MKINKVLLYLVFLTSFLPPRGRSGVLPDGFGAIPKNQYPGFGFHNNKPLYIAEDIIIRFAPDVLDTNFIDNSKLNYSTVGKVITDTALIAEMDTRLGANGELGDWKLFKYTMLSNTSRNDI